MQGCGRPHQNLHPSNTDDFNIIKKQNAVEDDRVLKFLYDDDLRHIESSVRCQWKYNNGRIKVDPGTYTPYLLV